MAGKTTTSTPKAKPRRTAVKAKPIVTEAAPAPTVSIRQRKPIFGAGTWLAVLLLVALIGFTVYLNREKEKTGTVEATPTGEKSTVFSAADGSISSIEIKPSVGETVKVVRNAENAWAIEMPFEAEANQGLVEAAAAQVSALQVISPINAGKPEIFGLDKPAYVITIEFSGGKKHTLEVGDATPTNSGYYVRVDKDKMMVTDLSGIDSLVQLGFFPPYLNTPTALPPTLTPVPATEAVSTPVP